MTVTLEIVEDPARACAAMLVSCAIGGGEIVLTGGSTPRTAYEEFVRAVREVGLDLTKTTLWLGDERCVEPDDDRSNFKMIKETLLDSLQESNRPVMWPIKGELGPDRGAEDYERTLREAGGPSGFDLVLLGIGPDGHIASLFPDQASLTERSRLVVGVPEAGFEPFVPRVSLTLPALTAGGKIVVLVSGGSKADAVAAAFGPGAEPNPHVPASMLAASGKPVTVLLDRAAASHLSPKVSP